MKNKLLLIKNYGILFLFIVLLSITCSAIDLQDITQEDINAILSSKDSSVKQVSNVQQSAIGSDLFVESVDIVPQMIPPGSDAVIILNIKNIGNKVIKNVKVKLDLAGLKIGSIESTQYKLIESIRPGENQFIRFKIKPDGQMSTGIYNIPLVLSYNDPAGLVTEEYQVSIVINDKPKITPLLSENSVLLEKSIIDADFLFYNTGVTNIKNMKVTILQSDDYDILTNKDHFLGDIDSGNYQRLKQKLKPKYGKKEIIINFKVNFIDNLNTELSYTVSTPLLKVYTSYDASKYGLVTESKISLWIIITALTIIVISIFFYHKHNKEENKIKKIFK